MFGNKELMFSLNRVKTVKCPASQKAGLPADFLKKFQVDFNCGKTGFLCSGQLQQQPKQKSCNSEVCQGLLNF